MDFIGLFSLEIWAFIFNGEIMSWPTFETQLMIEDLSGKNLCPKVCLPGLDVTRLFFIHFRINAVLMSILEAFIFGF